MTPSPTCDASRCDGCGLCAVACPCHAVSLAADGPTFDCDGCCHHSPDCPTLLYCLWPCEEACPTRAIRCAFDILMPDEETPEAPDQA